MLVWKAYSRMLDALAFSPDGRALAIGGYHLACRLIDAATGAPLWTVKSGSTFGLSLAFMSDGAVLCREGSALIRPPGGAPYRLGAGVSIRSAADGAKVRHCGRWCQSFGPAPGGCTVFVADGGHLDLVRRYDLRDGEPTGEVELEAGVINRIAVSPGGTVVAAVGTKQFSLLNADTLAVVASDAQRALSSSAFALAFSPCGRTVVYSAGRTLFVWDAATVREVNRVSLDVKHFMDAAFTPDGRRLITVSKEGAARVWDAATWACERAFAWDVGPLRAVAVSPDGTRAAAAGDSGRVVVWDLDE